MMIPSWPLAALAASLMVLGSAGSRAQTFEVLHEFRGDDTDGGRSNTGLTAFGGKLYGGNESGGPGTQGTLFRINPRTDREQLLYDFSAPPDLAGLISDLVVSGKSLYGNCAGAGHSDGAIFRYDPAQRELVVLHEFAGGANDAAYSTSPPVIVGDSLFGASLRGGASDQGTVFRLDLSTLQVTVLYSFKGGTDGALPTGSVAVAGNVLYGTTNLGGAAGLGTMFGVDLSTGAETVLHSFTGAPSGDTPLGGVVLSGGNLYGTTQRGGRSATCFAGCGTVFRYDIASGKINYLYRFDSPGDGSAPQTRVLVHDGILYGTTATGGADDKGTLFSIDLSTNRKETLHAFTGTDGQNPQALTWYDGALVGLTGGGGTYFEGVAFRYSP